MANLDRRDRLAGRETDVGGCGECFIAMHMRDGSVHAISGMAECIRLERSDLVWDTLDYPPLRNEWDVTIHFPNGFVEEIRPMDGRSVDA
jgi:hypothetical protein